MAATCCSECGRNKVLARGFCGTCYARLTRHGAIKPSYRRGMTQSFLLQHTEHKSADCLIWPYGRRQKGYGGASLNGQKMAASRAMCILAHGSPPFDHAEAAHRCGVPACVNPNHLYWATPQQNSDDQIVHGTRSSGEARPTAKLSADDVAMILSDNRIHRLVAEDFGVSRTTVAAIKRGAVWTSVTGLPNKRTYQAKLKSVGGYN
jgi:hypothetical protein